MFVLSSEKGSEADVYRTNFKWEHNKVMKPSQQALIDTSEEISSRLKFEAAFRMGYEPVVYDLELKAYRLYQKGEARIAEAHRKGRTPLHTPTKDVRPKLSPKDPILVVSGPYQDLKGWVLQVTQSHYVAAVPVSHRRAHRVVLPLDGVVYWDEPPTPPDTSWLEKTIFTEEENESSEPSEPLIVAHVP